MKKIMLVGGGSGGHVFPLIAVQTALESASSEKLEFIVVSDEIDPEVQAQFSHGTEFLKITTGKVRRFAHWKWWQYFYPARYKFYLYNLVDVFKILIGYMQSKKIIKRTKPDVVFAKGGYVSVPVGIAAGRAGVPIVLHESDTRPGLASRALEKYTTITAHGFGQVADDLTVTGIPVRSTFFSNTMTNARKAIHLVTDKPLLVVTGGSLGAHRVNQIVVQNLDFLLKHFLVIHITGEKDYEAIKQQTTSRSRGEYQVFPFVGEKYPDVIVAADVILARAGATTIAELAAAAKPTIFLPNSYLTDQVSNARWLQKQNAGIVCDEIATAEDPVILEKAVSQMLDEQTRKRFAASIHLLARRDAADQLAKQIMSVCNRHEAR